MAIAELTEDYAAFASEAESALDGRVRLAIHDASRLEWSVSVPLPENAPLKYNIDVEMEIPSNAFARHTPWDQLQSFTRLDGPATQGYTSDALSIDALRRGAIALANRLARASEGLARHCRLAASLFAMAPPSDLEEALTIWIDAAVKMVEEGRAKLTDPRASDVAELARERKLVDEYMSVRFLEMLAGAERSLSGMLASKSAHVATFAPIVAIVEQKVSDALGHELELRAERGYVWADPTSPVALEQYLERSSKLKKHFQEVLFLEGETFQVAERIHNWVASFVALIASTWAVAWQLTILNKSRMLGSTLSSGFILIAISAGIVYAGKDRIKEIGRNWISGNVKRLYAHRVARFRAPARRLPKRDVIVSARESFDQTLMHLPDPLNPESGATLLATLIRYRHKGVVSPQATLSASGVRRVKHVFRYDLSPLFARLDDATKPVPVLDPTTRRVCFTNAPRCYRVPVRVRVTMGDHVQEELATLVLHKRGLERLDREDDEDIPSTPGLEPG